MIYLELRHDFVVAVSIIHTDTQKPFNRRPKVISTLKKKKKKNNPQNSVFILNDPYQENYCIITLLERVNIPWSGSTEHKGTEQRQKQVVCIF